MGTMNELDNLEDAIGEFPLDWEELDGSDDVRFDALRELEDAWSNLVDAYRDVMVAFGRRPEW